MSWEIAVDKEFCPYRREGHIYGHDGWICHYRRDGEQPYIDYECGFERCPIKTVSIKEKEL